MSEAKVGQIKLNKHIELHHAVESIDELYRMAGEIVARIKGHPSECEKGSETTEPSFLEVLDGGPDSIRQKVEAARVRMMEISDLLF